MINNLEKMICELWFEDVQSVISNFVIRWTRVLYIASKSAVIPPTQKKKICFRYVRYVFGLSGEMKYLLWSCNHGELEHGLIKKGEKLNTECRMKRKCGSICRWCATYFSSAKIKQLIWSNHFWLKL